MSEPESTARLRGTELVGSDHPFGDLMLKEELEYGGKTWQCYLVVPQEHLQDLFRTPGTISPTLAYRDAKSFWNRISELTRDLYREYLETQMIAPIGAIRRQWFQWKDFGILEDDYRVFTAKSNQPLRLSVIARDPAV